MNQLIPPICDRCGRVCQRTPSGWLCPRNATCGARLVLVPYDRDSGEPTHSGPCRECGGKREVECDECGGDGVVECDLGHEHPCPECKGTKKVPCPECGEDGE